jgi:hypothetical protein
MAGSIDDSNPQLVGHMPPQVGQDRIVVKHQFPLALGGQILNILCSIKIFHPVIPPGPFRTFGR